MTRIPRGWVIAAVAFSVDRLVKAQMVSLFQEPDAPHALAVTPFLDLVMVWNRGVSYGLLQTDSALGAWLLTTAIALIVVWALWATAREPRPRARLGLALVSGSGASNLTDRLLWGAVADSFSLHWGDWRWYVFNLADVGIVIGVALFLLDTLTARERSNSHRRRSRRSAP